MSFFCARYFGFSSVETNLCCPARSALLYCHLLLVLHELQGSFYGLVSMALVGVGLIFGLIWNVVFWVSLLSAWTERRDHRRYAVKDKK